MATARTLAIALMLATAAAPLAADAHGRHDEKQERDHAGRVRLGDKDRDASWTYLGVTMQRVSGDLAEALELKEDTGVLIGQVMEDSPAAEAGMESGDVVLSIDGEQVSTPEDLRDVVRSHSAGDAIKVRVNREGREKTFKVTLSEREAEFGSRPNARWLPRMDNLGERVRELRIGGPRGYLGVVTQELSGDLAEFFGAESGGVLVAEVVDESPAAKMGLRAGDVIVSVGGSEIGDPGELRREVSKQDDQAEVEIVWVRDKREKRGRVTLEMRESNGPFPRMQWFGQDSDEFPHDGKDIRRMLLRLDEDGDRQLVKRFESADEDGVRELMEELRAELDELRQEVKELKAK